MLGALIGDIVGSRFEFTEFKGKKFEFFEEHCHPTDDSLMTLAIAKALVVCKDWSDEDSLKQITMQVMKEHHAEEIPGVIHCFSYSKEMALEFIKMGYYIGVGGVVTFKNAKKLVETVEAIPMNRILLETDCPYMAPEPVR